METAELSESNCCCIRITCSQCRYQRDLLQQNEGEDGASIDTEDLITEPVLDSNTGKHAMFI